ncbi:MAG: hypothetical protein J0M12_15530, partial [Deltaproteobacteria bacterium]|nr:hypothetical protein [Deltaproteobacteria bacterium]
QLCQNEASGTMVDGRLNMQGRFPKASFERFSVMSNGVQARMRVANSGRRSASSKRLSSRSLQSLCGKFFKTLR